MKTYTAALIAGFAAAQAAGDSWFDTLKMVADNKYGNGDGTLSFVELANGIEAEGGCTAAELIEKYGEDFDWAGDESFLTRHVSLPYDVNGNGLEAHEIHDFTETMGLGVDVDTIAYGIDMYDQNDDDMLGHYEVNEMWHDIKNDSNLFGDNEDTNLYIDDFWDIVYGEEIDYFALLTMLADMKHGDGDGLLTFEELAKAIEGEGGVDKEYLMEVFGKAFDYINDPVFLTNYVSSPFDVNGDGLDAYEITNFKDTLGMAVNPDEIAFEIDTYDMNNDDRLGAYEQDEIWHDLKNGSHIFGSNENTDLYDADFWYDLYYDDCYYDDCYYDDDYYMQYLIDEMYHTADDMMDLTWEMQRALNGHHDWYHDHHDYYSDNWLDSDDWLDDFYYDYYDDSWYFDEDWY